MLRGGKLTELLEVSLSIAVAVVPEGLLAVITVTLALATQRMVRRHALIRKLPAVETLGLAEINLRIGGCSFNHCITVDVNLCAALARIFWYSLAKSNRTSHLSWL